MSTCTSICRLKKVENDQSGSADKVLGFWDLFLINVGGILGSGVYTAIVQSSLIAGPAVSITFILTSICCILSCLPFAEFSSKISESGGSYTFAYASLGEFMAFLYLHYIESVIPFFLDMVYLVQPLLEVGHPTLELCCALLALMLAHGFHY